MSWFALCCVLCFVGLFCFVCLFVLFACVLFACVVIWFVFVLALCLLFCFVLLVGLFCVVVLSCLVLSCLVLCCLGLFCLFVLGRGGGGMQCCWVDANNKRGQHKTTASRQASSKKGWGKQVIYILILAQCIPGSTPMPEVKVRETEGGGGGEA
jgi:hypothetical protein